MCLQNFPCQEVERHNKPEVELKTSPELLLNPVSAFRESKSDGRRFYIFSPTKTLHLKMIRLDRGLDIGEECLFTQVTQSKDNFCAE
ncbi:hypothetical protein ZWY2020_008234 [Hordeum vulgare]|nr:hypothetical protein ZWY2020_008234 [Hordeum vulgare]